MSSASLPGAVAVRDGSGTGVRRKLSRRALQGAFLFFLVKGLLWLAAPIALLLAR